MKYEILELHNLKDITGSGKATNTLTCGLSSAATGVKWCTAGGPWAMAGCGVIGGVIGYNAP